MLDEVARNEIHRLWKVKEEQDAANLPQSQRHRNLEPASAEFLCALVAGIGARKIVEVGGSSGISTIALATAARQTGGKLISLEIEPERQDASRRTIEKLGLFPYVDYRLGDAAATLPHLRDLEFTLIDCEKEDYIRFFDMLAMAPNGIVVADNILSHHLADYVAHVRNKPNVESITLAIGKGLELTRFVA